MAKTTAYTRIYGKNTKTATVAEAVDVAVEALRAGVRWAEVRNPRGRLFFALYHQDGAIWLHSALDGVYLDMTRYQTAGARAREASRRAALDGLQTYPATVNGRSVRVTVPQD
jgi:hypothetical protein